jgi:hypothetical protein
MLWYVLAPSALVSVLGAVSGVAAIRTGWVLPWLRRRTLRPRLWGYGVLLMSVFLAAQVVDGAVAGPHSQLLVIGGGLVLFLTGSGLMLASQQPGRPDPRPRGSDGPGA